jgi:hypothetical protein
MMSRGYTRSAVNLRQEVAEIVLSRPSDGLPPALLCWFCKHLVIYLEWKVFLRFQRLESLRSKSLLALRNCDRNAYNSHGLQLGHNRVCKDANLLTIMMIIIRRRGKPSDLAGLHVLEVHANLAGDAFSKSQI